jgi:crotonyl-CoA reductase
MKQGDRVLVWGASGGLGSYAVQYVLNGGGTPVGVVSSPDKVEPAARARGRGGDRPQGGRLPVLEGRAHPGRVGVAPVRQGRPVARGRGPRHRLRAPGRQTMGASVFVQAGGTIVTCAATSGYMIEYDNRHLWMKLKTIKGSHFANYREAWDANQLICEGKVLPPSVGRLPARRGGRGRLPGPPQPPRGQDRRPVPGPEEGLGIDDPELRARWARTGSPVPEARGMSGGAVGGRRARRTVHRDRPRRHRRARPRRRHRLVRGGVRGRVAHRERVESDGSKRRSSPWPTPTSSSL